MEGGLPARARPRPRATPAAHDIVPGPMADDVAPRNETLRATRCYGRAFRKRRSGYPARGRAEARMRGLKAFGARTAAVRRCRPDQWRSSGASPTAGPPNSTSASPA